MAKITIRDVRPILTAPAGIPLVVVKIETSEPGLYGLGCATFTQRFHAVAATVTEHLRPLMIGRDVARIEESFHLMMNNGYWRNGPVLNNAIAGVDVALWDIKGKLANMPLYDLLGGKCREAADVYMHADGRELAELEDRVQAYVDRGLRHVRVQFGGYGGAGARSQRPDGALEGAYYDPRHYTRTAIEALEHIRAEFGAELEIVHDVHERLPCAQAVEFARLVEPYGLFFLEDLLSPEHSEWFANVRAVCATPLAMGELFVHPREWQPLIVSRQIDFIRMHMSTMAGLTPARKVAALAEQCGVRTAWHGPPDLSPVGQAVNLHLDVVLPNFGVQEFSPFNDATEEVFPGCPELRGGYLYPNDKPGIGVDVDEAAAAKYPCEHTVVQWTQSRLPDGSLHRP